MAKVLTNLRKRPNGRENGRAAGFTLVETLVALAVAAVCVAALTRVVSNVRMNAREIRELVAMLTISDSLLQESAPKGAGVTDGYRAGFVWRVATTPVDFTATAHRMNPKKKPGLSAQPNKTLGLQLSNGATDEAQAAPKAPTVDVVPFHVNVLVKSRSGRTYAADTISVGPAPPRAEE
jgi:prepilin-type N-terminal cleavage/methylation domain-containing protein